jgi:lipopolysaccharide transport system ATP-binding protein
MSAVLKVSGVGKAYRTYRRELHRVLSWFGVRVAPKTELWVLEDVSFSVEPGEAVGIIGQNGAGKSTLLKIITGTLKASAGHVEVNGKVAAILELGMGFHPDLSGRQNAYHAASLMGFTTVQIDAVIQQIQDFAEIGDYFDQPVRTYSSGMQMRVAFAVATAYRPEILIIDEALSVGDAYFQHKCFNLIRDFQAKGTSLLFVSHDSASIQSLCNRAVLLHKGKLLKVGTPKNIIDLYNAILADPDLKNTRQDDDENNGGRTRSGSGEAHIARVQLLDDQAIALDTCSTGQNVTFKVDIDVREHVDELVCGFVIRDRAGNWIFGINSKDYGHDLENLVPGQRLQLSYAFALNLGEGTYSISVALTRSHRSHVEKNYDWLDLAHVFKVVNISKKHFAGLIWLDAQVELRLCDSSDKTLDQVVP